MSGTIDILFVNDRLTVVDIPFVIDNLFWKGKA